MTDSKTDSLLDMIPQESHFYYYFRGCWANGKEGSITDSNGHGVFRFFPLIKDDKGNRIDAEIDFDDYDTNPIVATGIIGYWLHFHKNNNRLASYTTWTKEDERKSTLKIFNDYTEDKLKQYIEREQYSLSCRLDMGKGRKDRCHVCQHHPIMGRHSVINRDHGQQRPKNGHPGHLPNRLHDSMILPVPLTK